MIYDTPMVVAGSNLLICAGIFWACICRLNSEVSKRYLKARARYTLLLTGSVVSAFQPILFGEWPTKSSTALALAVFAGLALNASQWANTRRGEQ